MTQSAAENASGRNSQLAPQDDDSALKSLKAGIGGWVRVGVWIITLTFAGLGSWAAVAKIAGAVLAEGTIKVDSSRKRIQHQEGGTIKDILVRDGERIKSGQVLLRLDETRAKASMGIIQANYDALLARHARLQAERDEQATITFPHVLTAREDIAAVAELIQGQLRLFNARRKTLAGSIEILERQILQLRNKIDGIVAQKNAKNTQLQLVNEELRDMQKLLTKGYIDKTRVLVLQKESARLEGEWGGLVAEQAEAGKAVSEKQQEIMQLNNDFERGVIDELRETQTAILDASERMDAARYVLDNVEIRSPTDGIVEGLAVFSRGEVIGPGETVLEVVPMHDRLLIEAPVKTTEIDNLSLGQMADLRFSAFNQRTTPVLQGRLHYISADAFEDDRTGLSFYRVRVTVSDSELDKLGGQALHPGMPVEVVIKLSERTVVQYMMQPLTSAFAKAWREE